MKDIYTEYKEKFLKFVRDNTADGTFDHEALYSYGKETFEHGFLDLYGRCMELMCEYYLYAGDIEKYLLLYAEFGRVAQEKQGLLLLSCLRLNAYYLANYTPDLEKATTNLETALALYRENKIDNPQALYKLNQTMGVVYYIRCENVNAMKYFYEALQCKLHKATMAQKGTTYVWIGTIEIDRHNYSAALYNFLKAAEIFRKYNKYHALVSALVQHACIYMQMKKFKEAHDVLIETLEIAEKHNYEKGRMGVFHVLGMYHRLTGNYEKSEQYLLSIIELNKQNTIHQGQVNLELGYLYTETKEYEKAHTSFLKAAELFAQLKSDRHLTEIYVATARLFLKQKIYDNVKIYIDKIEKILSHKNEPHTLKEVYELYYKYYEGLKKYSKALKYSKLLIEILTNLYEGRQADGVEQNEIKYHIERSEGSFTTPPTFMGGAGGGLVTCNL